MRPTRDCCRLIRSINEIPLSASGQAVPITISIGIARLQADTHSLDELVSNADQALYRAKSAGRNCRAAFEPLGTAAK